METTGKLINITRDFMTNKLNVTFQISTEPVDELNTLATLDAIDITAKEHKKKRSLDANSYFHVLCGKIADKVGVSKTHCKNILIGRYGQQDFLEDGKPIIIKSNVSVEKMMEQEFLHTMPCGTKVENGMEVVFYKVFRGSHTLDSKEFSILLEGTVQEAKDLGIETIPPAELERMVSKWQAKT